MSVLDIGHFFSAVLQKIKKKNRTNSKQILNTAASIHGCNTATAPLWTLKIKDGGLGLQLPSLLLAPAYLSSLCLVAKDLNTLVDPSSLPKNTFPRTWAALSEAHALLHPFFRDHFESKPQSPLKNSSEKLPRTPGPSTHLRMPLRKSYRRNSQVQFTKHSRRHTAATPHQRLYNTSTPSPTLNLARDT